MLYLELVSRPLTQDLLNAPSLPAALAERCGAKEAVALILMRAGGAIRFWLGFPDRLAEHAILECRHSGFGYRAGEIPSFRSGVRSVLRCPGPYGLPDNAYRYPRDRGISVSSDQT